MSPFQATEKKIEDNPLQRILAARPRHNNPAMPSLSTTASAASTYVIGTSDVWTAVLTTRVEFETQSATTLEAKPMAALLNNFFVRDFFGGGGTLASR